MGFDIDRYISMAYEGKCLDRDTIRILTMKVQDILVKEATVLRVSSPISMVGDIHGQFHDLLELFKCTGRAPWSSFLFLGDYVDRGEHSIQVITLLCLLKVKYPSRIFMIRGNHETRTTNSQYGFYGECQSRYGDTQVWQDFNVVFDYLPMAAVVDGKIFCVHGGLSPQIETVEELEQMNRFQDMPPEGAFIDLMWSDPGEDENFSGFEASSRNAGYVFGRDMVERFLGANGLTRIVRAHQLCQKGYTRMFDDKFITVWSAPNYTYRFKNKACALEMDEHLNMNFNVFTWSKENEEIKQERDTRQQENLTNQFFR